MVRLPTTASQKAGFFPYNWHPKICWEAFIETPLHTEWNVSNRDFWVPSYPPNPTSYSGSQVFLSTILNPCHTLQLWDGEWNLAGNTICHPLPSVDSRLCLDSLWAGLRHIPRTQCQASQRCLWEGMSEWTGTLKVLSGGPWRGGRVHERLKKSS